MKIYNLDDLDTAFPREGHLCLKLTFENGSEIHINSNCNSIDTFKHRWNGETVRLGYYNKDKFAPVTKLVNVEQS
jgi:hypothetical protein